MTKEGNTPEFENIPYVFEKSVIKKKMAILFKIFWEKVDFFLAIFTSFMAALDAQQNFMQTRNLLFSFYLFLIKSYSVFCQKVAKVEHTICDCN